MVDFIESLNREELLALVAAAGFVLGAILVWLVMRAKLGEARVAADSARACVFACLRIILFQQLATGAPITVSSHPSGGFQ